jgi:RHS repeat-associated protein
VFGYGAGVQQSIKFTGKERDAETGLDYFETRYMSAAQGRFTTPDDPLVDQYPSDPQSWNLYGYVRNNPLRNVDPTGRDCIYTNTFDEKAGTVQVETGSCSQKGGTYVAGTISSITYDSNSNSLDYGYNAYTGGTASVGSTNLPDPGLQALQRGALLAEPGVNIAAAGTAIVMSGAFVGAAYGAWAGGTALTTLSIPAATLPPLVSNPTLQGIVNKLFQATDKLPGGTAGAVRYELATGDLMSPSGHSGKAQEVIVALTNLLKSGKLTFNDQIVSRQIIQELSDALKTQPRR